MNNQSPKNKKFQKQQSDKVTRLYESALKDFREIENFQTPFGSNFLSEALKSIDLNTFSSLSFFWLNYIQKYLEVIDCLTDQEASEEDQFDYLFDYWNDSDFAKDLQSNITGSDIITLSYKLLALFEKQIESFFFLHISTKTSSEELTYRPLPELGENSSCLMINNQDWVKVPAQENSYILIQEINKSENYISIKNKKYSFNKTQSSLSKHNFDLFFPDEKLKKDFQDKVENTLSLIKKIDKDLYSTLESFTTHIIPINESGIVSYSMQSLPGYSLINMFDRDSIDLLDDLLHENGHHYLNTFLNTEELIFEDDDKKFYSPWRRSLRPIRGIYHAYLTFYWAFDLFKSINSQLSKLNFNEAEEHKIQTRFLEELIMLKFTYKDLELAYKEGKVSDKGIELVRLFHSELSEINENDFSLDQNEEITNLVNVLNKARKEYYN